MRRSWIVGVLVVCCGQLPVTAQLQPTSARRESEIRAFEAIDRTNPPPSRACLFAGSYSIRLWKSLGQDFAGVKVINRGFDGSQIEDVTFFADRIVWPYRPRMILLYAGDNDLAAGKTPERVFADFRMFVEKVRAKLPDVPIAFISIKPSPARRPLLDRARTANKLVEDYTRHGRGLTYIDVFTPMLGADGQPRSELFIEDKLHLNAQGYALWREIIRPHLKPPPAEE
jgi:lysophospholipase L1-like esterase